MATDKRPSLDEIFGTQQSAEKPIGTVAGRPSLDDIFGEPAKQPLTNEWGEPVYKLDKPVDVEGARLQDFMTPGIMEQESNAKSESEQPTAGIEEKSYSPDGLLPVAESAPSEVPQSFISPKVFEEYTAEEKMLLDVDKATDLAFENAQKEANKTLDEELAKSPIRGNAMGGELMQSIQLAGSIRKVAGADAVIKSVYESISADDVNAIIDENVKNNPEFKAQKQAFDEEVKKLIPDNNNLSDSDVEAILSQLSPEEREAAEKKIAETTQAIEALQGQFAQSVADIYSVEGKAVEGKVYNQIISRLAKLNIPKSDLEYIGKAIYNNSLMGTLYELAVTGASGGSGTDYMVSQQALAMANPSAIAKVVGGAGAILVDTGIFGALGAGGSLVGGAVRSVATRAVAGQIARKAAVSATNKAVKQVATRIVEKNVLQQFATAAISQGLTLGSYNGLLTAAQETLSPTGENGAFNWRNVFHRAGEGLATGAVVGGIAVGTAATKGAMYRARPDMAYTAKGMAADVGVGLAGFTAENLAFVGLGSLISGEEFTAEAIGESFATLGVLKGVGALKRIAKGEKLMQQPDFVERTLSDLKFTPEEMKAMREAGVDMEVMDFISLAVTEMNNVPYTESRRSVINAYNTVMASREIPTSAKVKLKYIVTGEVPRVVGPSRAEVVEGENGIEVRTYDYQDRVVQIRPFETTESATKFVSRIQPLLEQNTIVDGAKTLRGADSLIAVDRAIDEYMQTGEYFAEREKAYGGENTGSKLPAKTPLGKETLMREMRIYLGIEPGTLPEGAESRIARIVAIAKNVYQDSVSALQKQVAKQHGATVSELLHAINVKPDLRTVREAQLVKAYVDGLKQFNESMSGPVEAEQARYAEQVRPQIEQGKREVEDAESETAFVRESLNEAARRMATDDGKHIAIVRLATGEQVAVYKGRIVTKENGTIDTEASENTVVIKRIDAEGNEVRNQVGIGEIAEVVEFSTPEAAVEESMSVVEAQAAKKLSLDNAIAERGEQGVEVVTIDGNSGKIVGIDDNGAYILRAKGESGKEVDVPVSINDIAEINTEQPAPATTEQIAVADATEKVIEAGLTTDIEVEYDDDFPPLTEADMAPQLDADKIQWEKLSPEDYTSASAMLYGDATTLADSHIYHTNSRAKLAKAKQSVAEQQAVIDKLNSRFATLSSPAEAQKLRKQVAAAEQEKAKREQTVKNIEEQMAKYAHAMRKYGVEVATEDSLLAEKARLEEERNALLEADKELDRYEQQEATKGKKAIANTAANRKYIEQLYADRFGVSPAQAGPRQAILWDLANGAIKLRWDNVTTGSGAVQKGLAAELGLSAAEKRIYKAVTDNKYGQSVDAYAHDLWQGAGWGQEVDDMTLKDMILDVLQSTPNGSIALKELANMSGVQADLEAQISLGKGDIQRKLEEADANLAKNAQQMVNFRKRINDTVQKLESGEPLIIPVGEGEFGPIYDQFKGKPQEAVDFLLSQKNGEAIGALSHKDIGEIDLVWGKEGTGHSDGYGLSKLAKYHPEVLDKLQPILDDMEVVSRNTNRVNLESPKYQAAVRLTWNNERKNWLLTAFEKRNSAIDNTTDTGETAISGKQNDTATLQSTASENKDTTSIPENQISEEEIYGNTPLSEEVPFMVEQNAVEKPMDTAEQAFIRERVEIISDLASMGPNVVTQTHEEIERTLNEYKAGAEELRASIEAYHGSGAAFEKFDHKFMGTGEGAQAFGYGTYVTEVENIARGYAKASGEVKARKERELAKQSLLLTRDNIAKQRMFVERKQKELVQMEEHYAKLEGDLMATVFPHNRKRLKETIQELANDIRNAKGEIESSLFQIEQLKPQEEQFAKVWEQFDAQRKIAEKEQHIEWKRLELVTLNRKLEKFENALDSLKHSGKMGDELVEDLIAMTNLRYELEGKDEMGAQEALIAEINRVKKIIEGTERGISIIQKEIEELQAIEQPKFRNLYSVEVPDNTGENYLPWADVLTPEMAEKVYPKVIEALQTWVYGLNGEKLYPLVNGWQDIIDKYERGLQRSGEQVYHDLNTALHSPKVVSELLHSLGFVGIEYPAQHTTGGRADGAKNYVIFNADDVQIKEHIQYLKTPQGVVYGFTIGDTSYIDIDELNPETPVHEYTEWWSKIVAKNNPKLWERGKELLKETETWKEVNEDPNYKDLSEDLRASETLSRIAAKEAGKKMSEVSDNKTLIAKLRAWIRKFWGDIKATFAKWTKKDLQNLTVNQFSHMPLRDLFEGIDLRKYRENNLQKPQDNTLVGIHNISLDKLQKALKQGGLANPSAAVIDIAKGDHFDYGEYSFIMPKSLVDKKSGRNIGTFDRDAWTPLYPSVEYSHSKESKKNINKLVEDLDEGLADKIKRETLAKVNGKGFYSGLQIVFLKERGVEVPIASKAGNFFGTIDEFKQLFGGKEPTYENYQALDKTQKDEVTLWIRAKGMPEEIARYKELLVKPARKEGLWNFLLDDVGYGKFDKAVYGLQADVRNTGTPDYAKTIENAVTYIRENGLQEEFDAWQSETFNNLGFDERIQVGWSPSGDRIMRKNTLENVSKYMRRQGKNASSDHWSNSEGKMLAQLSQNFSSLDKIRANKWRLRSAADDVVGIRKRINQAAQLFMNFGKNTDLFMEEQSALAYLEDILVGGMNPDKVVEEFNKVTKRNVTLTDEQKTELKQLREDMKNLPVQYFETKFERPVMFNEFAAVVAPDTMPEAMEKQLRDAGLAIYKYNPDVEGDRRKATLAATASEDIRFMIDNSEKNTIFAQTKNNNETGFEQNNDEQRPSNSGRVAGNTTPSMAKPRKRGDIRVLEEGVGSKYSEHPEYSKRDRRNAESERLIDTAKKNGLFISYEETKKLGDKYPKRTGESVVYISDDEGKVYKVKNPYAHSAMKSGVQPEEAIFEHTIHNMIFPETVYTFEGISEDLGDVRIVLSQKIVESVGYPTKQQIANALSQKGLVAEDNYYFGNDLISVTDVEGENALLGKDGKVYFIDPTINFKKPAREIISELGQRNAPTRKPRKSAAEKSLEKIESLREQLKNKKRSLNDTLLDVYNFLTSKDIAETMGEGVGKAQYRRVIKNSIEAIRKAYDVTDADEKRKTIFKYLGEIDDSLSQLLTRQRLNEVTDILDKAIYGYTAQGVRTGKRIDEHTREIFDILRNAIGEPVEEERDDSGRRKPVHYRLKNRTEAGDITSSFRLRSVGSNEGIIAKLRSEADDIIASADVLDTATTRAAAQLEYASNLLSLYDNALQLNEAIGQTTDEIADIQREIDRTNEQYKAAATGSEEKRNLYKMLQKLQNDLEAEQMNRAALRHRYASILKTFTTSLEELDEKGAGDFARAELAKAEQAVKWRRGIYNSIKNPNAPVLPVEDYNRQGKEVKVNWKGLNTRAKINESVFMATFAEMSRDIDINSIPGQWAKDGWYYQFMLSEGGYMARTDWRYKTDKALREELDAEVLKLSGDKKADEPYKLFAQLAQEPSGLVIPRLSVGKNKEGKTVGGYQDNIPLTIGQILYMRNAIRQPNGYAGYLAWGIPEEDMKKIAQYAEANYPKYCRFFDWVVLEFMPKLYEMQDAIYFEKFGTHLPKTAFYFPFVRDKRMVGKVAEVGEGEVSLPSSVTGNIVERVKTSAKMDLQADAFSVLQDHIKETLDWCAYVELTDKFNSVGTSHAFGNMLKAQGVSVQKLKEMYEIAVGQGKINSTDNTTLTKTLNAISKGLVAGNIVLNPNAAIKQIVSATATLGYSANPKLLAIWAKNFFVPSVIKTGIGKVVEQMKRGEIDPVEAIDWKVVGDNWKWAIENIPTLRERWEGREAGFEVLKSHSFDSWDKLTAMITNAGLAPNAFVDMLTCSNVAKTVYEYEYPRLLERGRSKKEAHREACVKAAIFVNETQQSSLNGFLSSFQSGGGLQRILGVGLGAYQNSSMAFARNERFALTNMLRMANSSTRNDMQMRQIEAYKELGVEGEKATELAKQDLRESYGQQVAGFVHNGVLNNYIWKIAGVLLGGLASAGFAAMFDKEEWNKLWKNEKFRQELASAVSAETLAWQTPLFYNAPITKQILEYSHNVAEGKAYGGIFESPTSQSAQDLIDAIFKQWVGVKDEVTGERETKEPTRYDRSAEWLVVSTLIKAGLGVNPDLVVRMAQGIDNMMKDGVQVEDVMATLASPRGLTRAIAGEPRPGESKEEYLDRMLYIYRQVNAGSGEYDKKFVSERTKEYIDNKDNELYRELGIVPRDARVLEQRIKAIKKQLVVFDRSKEDVAEFNALSKEERDRQIEMAKRYDMVSNLTDNIYDVRNIQPFDEEGMAERKKALLDRYQLMKEVYDMWIEYNRK